MDRVQDVQLAGRTVNRAAVPMDENHGLSVKRMISLTISSRSRVSAMASI